jgi:ABC-type amino acid transport substrate-binding protein
MVAALLVIGTVALTAVVGTRLDRAPDQQSRLFSLVEDSQSIRIAVRPDHPQFQVGGATVGFDTDVAAALAQRMGLSLVGPLTVDAETQLRDPGGGWVVDMPSVADWRVDPARFLVSDPYYRWPHRLVVPAESSVQRPVDLAGQPVCAVQGDLGADWLRGTYGGTHDQPITTDIVTMPTDDACLSALNGGQVAAFVTATLSDADISVRGNLRVIGGPDPEPRSIIVPRPTDGSRDPDDLLREINTALSDLRSTGVLTTLSEKRFGGADLSAP